MPVVGRLVVRICLMSLCVLAGCRVLIPLPPAMAQSIDYRDPAAAPPSWTQFAKLVQYRFETWLGADEAIAKRFRAFIVERSGKQGGPPSMLLVRAWLSPDGTVERVAFPALNDARAEDDFRTILTRGNIGERPPPDMLQPLNLRLSLNLKR